MKSFLSNEAISEIAEYGLYCQSRDGLDVGSLRATKASIADTCLKGFKDESAEKAESDLTKQLEKIQNEVRLKEEELAAVELKVKALESKVTSLTKRRATAKLNPAEEKQLE